MKTRLLRKLRREANEHFRFVIRVEKIYGVVAEVFSLSLGKRLHLTVDGIDGAKKFCRLATNQYILDRIKELRSR